MEARTHTTHTPHWRRPPTYQRPLSQKTLRELFLKDQKLSTLHCHECAFPKRNPILIASPWALLRTRPKWDQFAALMQLFCTSHTRQDASCTVREVQLAAKGCSTTVRIHTECVSSPLHCRGIMRGSGFLYLHHHPSIHCFCSFTILPAVVILTT